MKVTVKSEVLTAMVDKISKGTEQVDIHIVSTYVSIEALNGDLILRTTDGTHLMKIRAKEAVDPTANFYACVPNQLFCNLIKKLYSAQITLSLTDLTLDVKAGNSEYSLPLSIDPASEDNAIYRMQDIPFEVSEETVEFTITKEELESVLTFNVVSTTDRERVAAIMANYYIDKEGFCTYDGTFCENKMKLAETVQALLPLKFMDLCKVFDASSVKFMLNKDKVKVVSGNDELTYKLSTDKFNIADYPIEQLKNLINRAFGSSISVSKKELTDALDRLSLFNKEDKQVIIPIKFIFAEDKLTVFDSRNKNIDVIKLVSKNNVQQFEAEVSLTGFKKLLSCHTSENITLSYDVTNNIGMMITDKNVNQLIPYSVEE